LQRVSNHEGPNGAAIVAHVSRSPSNPNCQTATSRFLGRMCGRRTGVHPGSSPGQAFAWTCSAILAADFSARVSDFLFDLLPVRERLCSLKRGSGAPYGATVLRRAPATEHVPAVRRPARLTALHCGVLRTLGPLFLIGLLHPKRCTGLSTRGCIVSRGASQSLPGPRLRIVGAGTAPDPRSVSLCRAPLSESGYS
jgi:hypothetical protein